ncbi:MAG: hypothetical protein L7S56_00575 [Candidatus Poseidonia sp.]|nr:hypothetical protein [Poseidonia sp.]
MVDGFLGSLTTEERTLLHLLNQQLPSGGWEAPAALTQAGISAAVHVQRKHIPRTLKHMEKQGYINVEQRHIPGGKQRKRVYTLTEVGTNAANSLSEGLLSKEIHRDGKKTILKTLHSNHQSILELLSHLDEGLSWSEQPLVSPVSNPDGMASIDAQYGEELVRRMFSRAWEDGKITRDEQSLLNEVVDFLGMHPERVRRLSNEARKAANAPPPEDVYYEMILQALEDGEVMEEELALLDTFRIAYGIDSVTHNSLLERAKTTPQFSEHFHQYAAAVKTAYKDKIITADEHAILRTLREQLKIPESEHNQIMGELTGQVG